VDDHAVALFVRDTSPKASARNERLAWQAKPISSARNERLAWQAEPISSARNERLAWQAKPISISARQHVQLDAVAHELLGQLAHVAGKASLDDRRVLPAQDQDARRAHGGAGHYR
jgi:hypothetical protein